MTADTYNLTIKPTFLSELVALPPKEALQVQKKLALLAEDPTPDAKTKKQLRHMDGKLHRLRSGDFRVFYTFEHPYISVLALRRRAEDTYDEDLDADFLGGGDVSAAAVTTGNAIKAGKEGKAGGAKAEPASTLTTLEDRWDRWLVPPKKKASAQLPRVIDKALLEALGVPKAFYASLTAVGTEDELLECPVPQDVLTKVIDAVLSRPLEEVAAQPDLVVAHPDDLLRFRDRELLGFLLRLNTEQEKFVSWGAKGKGATLLKGSPGTGKSTVALYRAREMVRVLRKAGVSSPRILFTTYTRALTRVSEQLLGSLLGEDAGLVEVRTADAIAREVAPTSLAYAGPEERRRALARAVTTVKFSGNALKVAAQQKTVAGLEKGFLLEEIQEVIEARGLTSLEAYLEAPRPGRGAPLTKVQREAVFQVREAFVTALAAAKLVTWEQTRARAAEKVASGEVPPRYDAVIIDEAQDLQPSAIRLLVGLCKTPGGVFLTADANQSIYGGGFRWSEVHAFLQFQGRTGILKANHRSTREIALAAESYLRAGDKGGKGAALETSEGEAEAIRYVHTGPMPAVRAVSREADEAKLLSRFFRSATRELRLGLGACAVLCPYKKHAARIAEALSKLGLPAVDVASDEIDLKQNGVKVLTLKSAKGLEFPIVALAGFLDEDYPHVPAEAAEEDRAELFARERRTMYVAMTRPMRALLVVVPEGASSPLLTGFSAERWNMGTGAVL